MSIAHYNVSEIKKSTDYKKFKTLDFQRPVSGQHVYKLMESIKECNLLNANPIIVDKNYYIIDGQHRLAACKQLKTPVYYQVVDVDAEENSNVIININKHEAWTLVNYIDFHANQNNLDYERAINLSKLYNIPINIIIYLAKKVSGSKATLKIRAGEMKIPEDAEAFLEIFTNFNLHCKDLLPKKYHSVLRSQVWASAHYHCYIILGNRYNHFLDQLKKGIPSLIAMRLKEDYLKFFDMHANKGMKANKFNIFDPETD